MRTTALVAGVFYVVTFLTSIPAIALYAPVLNDPDHVLGPGPDTFLRWGACLEVVLALSCTGTVVTLREAGADPSSLATAGRTLVAIHDWTFLLGPGLIPAVSALCLGYLVHRSRLVPRAIPLLGLVGAPLLLAAATATLFGFGDQLSTWSTIAAAPVALWELSLGCWLIVRGFTPAAPGK